MDKPLYEIYRSLYPSYVEKKQPLISSPSVFRSAVILLASIMGVAILILLSGCDEKPVWAEEIDLNIIAQIESNVNPMAYNQKTQATGMYQITPICLADFRQSHKLIFDRYTMTHFTMEDMFDDYYNYIVARWYLNGRIPQLLKYYIKDYFSIKNLDLYIIACYNWGIGNVVKWHKQGSKFNKLPKETQNYWRKYVAINKKKSNKF